MARPIRRPSTPNDLEMTDTAMSPVPSPRQPLPTSLASFALSHSTSAPTSPSTSTSIMSIDREDLAWPALLGAAPSFPTIRKLRRSSLLSSRPTDRADHTSSGSGSGSRSTRSGSPINTVFPNWDDEDTKEPSQSPIDQSPADSEEPTASNTDTALRLDTNVSGETTQIPRQMTLDDYGLSSSLPSPMVDKSIDPPSTPRLAPHLGPALVPSPPSSKPIDVPKSSMVRLRPLQYQNQYSHAFADLSTPFPPQHLKPARLIAVLQETNVQEAELQSEASFQRLVASHAELPLAFHPRTPRSARGRFPEEFSAEDDDDRKKDGDDDSDDDDVVFGAPSGESGVAEASAWANDTPAMDVEMVCKPLFYSHGNLRTMSQQASSSGSPSVTSSAMHSVMSTPQPASATPQTLSLSWRDNGGVAAMTGRAPKRKRMLAFVTLVSVPF